MEGENPTVQGVRPRRRKSEKEIPVVIPEAADDSSFVLGFCEDRNPTRRRKMEVRRREVANLVYYYLLGLSCLFL